MVTGIGDRGLHGGEEPADETRDAAEAGKAGLLAVPALAEEASRLQEQGPKLDGRSRWAWSIASAPRLAPMPIRMLAGACRLSAGSTSVERARA